MAQLRISVRIKGKEKRGIIFRLLIIKKILKISKLMRHEIMSLLCC